MWRHGEKPCYKANCIHHCPVDQSCFLYTTIREKVKSINKAGQEWRCINRIGRFKSLISMVEDCWEWRGRYTGNYDMKYFDNFHGETNAARVAWLLFKGLIPEGHRIKRTCDNPRCVKPSHHVCSL